MNDQTLYICYGLPASGKSTWAKKFSKENENVKRLSRDDLRMMLDGYSMHYATEKAVTKIIHDSMRTCLSQGFSIIMDNTNLKESYVKGLLRTRDLVDPSIAVEVKAFDAPFEELVKRNNARDMVVPLDVMERMRQQAKQFTPAKLQRLIDDWEGEKFANFQQITQDSSLPKAVIFDIDGTLAHMTSRGPYDYDKVITDSVDEVVKIILMMYYESGYRVQIFSGRDSVARHDTERWLEINNIPYHSLIMREKGDKRKDSIVKREMVDRLLGTWYVEVVFDDRDQVVEMWRSIGLKCLQVQPGAF